MSSPGVAVARFNGLLGAGDGLLGAGDGRPVCGRLSEHLADMVPVRTDSPRLTAGAVTEIRREHHAVRPADPDRGGAARSR
ncbi:hypothetical protein GCM10010365_57030 [Streptomyces poonensis]|uniref:Uncharacterized protein n=1 Tax=Streptomyces poonensis TaxID=68255 RepID=A0A918Q2A5_9ACTN|nr:hypothetical protein GCM10010365_57030 [Streptomyces poonensis]